MNMKFSREGERGNVLFLVLIAVILFAALSYAVTSSTRTQGSKVDSTDTLGAAELAQYPTSLRTAVMAMMVDGISADQLQFNEPADFGTLTNVSDGVFHPSGGGASYQAGSASVMSDNNQGQWYFNAEFEIENVGIGSASSFSGNEIIAFLPGIKQSICSKINERVGISSAIPDSSVDMSASYKISMNNTYTLPSGEVILGTGGSNGTNALTGQPFACFRNNGGEYVYYQVLVER